MTEKTDFDSIMSNHRQKIKELKHKVKGKGVTRKLLTETRYLYSLLEITRSISNLRYPHQLLKLIVDAAIDLTNAERGFLMLFGPDGNLEFKVTRNIDKKTIEGENFRISRSVVNHVLATRAPLFLSAIYKEKKFKISESIEALDLRMVMCVPLKAKDHPLGLIYVDSHSETEHFLKLEEKMFEAFAAQASVAIENSHLYNSSVRDALTGLYNYGYLRARLEEEITRKLRFKKDNISFIMLDLDNFKSINDSYGHLFGNSILVQVAKLIKEIVRKYDVPARYGGDEFAVLMPETDAQSARNLAIRLQKEIMELRPKVGKKIIPLSSSIGISTFPVEKIMDSENIIVEADHALFVAKNKGGNQIAVFGLRKDEKKREPELIGISKPISDIIKMTTKLAETDATVLITGETGTGKELVTNLIHRQSKRLDKPFVVVNCGAIPDNLLESELFGYEKGAFTGAYRQHKGKFELAHGGTICLDEICDLPLHLQVKLLRAIEQKEVDRIGGKAPIKVDVRVIAASNRNLEEEVKKDNFRKDLFYRLSVATIYIPPLRERTEDIIILSKYYLKKMNERYKRKFLGLTQSCMIAMMQHFWPGNVRELIHRIERAVIMATGYYIKENDLGLVTPDIKSPKKLRELRDELEKKTAIQSLVLNHWNITRSSRELGVTPKTLRQMIKRYKIIKETWENNQQK